MIELGCCGAYCKTYGEYLTHCKGCRNGYSDGSRDLSKAKCSIKRCCTSKKNICCADCNELKICPTIQDFFKKGYKYERYQASIEFIRKNGYEAFKQAASTWRRAYGKLK